MLSAFTPRAIVELKPRDKSKIESILAYGDRLLVGLSTGSLRVYRVNDVPLVQTEQLQDNEDAATSSKVKAVELLREEDKFSKKAITQMAIIKEASILISLSDACISFHDMQSYTLSERLNNTKGCSSFAVTSNIVTDANTGIPTIESRLAVAVKRRMILYTWQDMEISESVQEIVLSASIRSMTWMTGTKVVAGMDPGYAVIDVESRKMIDINRPATSGEVAAAHGVRFGAVHTSGMGYMGIGSWVPKPLSTKLSEGQMLLAKDVNTLFIDDIGTALEKRQVPWATAPEAIGYSYPYMLALQPAQRGVLEVRNPETVALLQSVSLPNAAILHVPQPYISLAHAGKGFLVASERCIWRMGAQSYDTQIEELIKKSLFDEALSLIGLLEDTLLDGKDEKMREIRIQKAQHLFKKKQYRAALELFADAQAPPARVIALYPSIIAGAQPQAGESGRGDTVSETRDHTSRSGDHVPSAIHVNILNKLKDDSGQGSTSSHSANEDSSHFFQPTSEHTTIGETDLVPAVNELNAFLAQTRAQLQRYINYDGTLKVPIIKDESLQQSKPAFEHLIVQDRKRESDDWQQELLDVAILVDTTLFRAYMLTRPTLAGPLFRLDNFCAPDVVEEKLYESKRYNDLIDFLYGKRLHNEALELLQKFGTEDDMDENLRGPLRTVRYLQQLPFEMIDTILRFETWPIEVDAELGMEVFLADTEMAETLPRDRVLEFLQGVDSALAMRYLEHIIEEFGDTTPEMHEQLIGMYLEKIGQASSTQEEQSRWQPKLEALLRQSEHYNKAKVLRDLPTSDDARYFESRITVLSKLGRHEEALHICVFQMSDYERAEDYCNEVYLRGNATDSNSGDPDDTSRPESIYTTLLSLYLAPPSPRSTNLDAALDLLSRHGSRLPALSTLSLLPSAQPIQTLESYFLGRMRAANSLAREEAVVAALRGVAKTDAESTLLLGARNRRVVVGENRLCGVCHRRFGRAAIKVRANGDVVHYGCVDRKRDDAAGRVGHADDGKAAGIGLYA